MKKGMKRGGALKNSSHRKGFTLAETLITLGIIGVVATLTLPNLVSNYKKKVYVAQIQKAYNQLFNAFSNVMLDEEVDDLSDSSLSTDEGVEAFLKKYFKAVLFCKPDEDGSNKNSIKNCLAENYLNIQKNRQMSATSMISGTLVTCAVINTGAAICLKPFTSSNNSVQVSIDVNGKNKPNIAGYDFYSLLVNSDTSEAVSFTNTDFESFKESCLSDEGEGTTSRCALWFIPYLQANGWTMDY